MAEKRLAKPGDHIAITTTVEGDAYEPGDVFEVENVVGDGVYTKEPLIFITHEEYEVLPKETTDLFHTNDGKDLLDEYMITPDERDQYEADGRAYPAYTYIEGAHGSPTPGKRKESDDLSGILGKMSPEQAAVVAGEDDALPYTITYVVLARLFSGNESVILTAFDSEEQANDFAEQFRAKRHPDYKDVKVESAIVQSDAEEALIDYFGDPNDDYDPYEDDYDPLCPNRVCCACCGCNCH